MSNSGMPTFVKCAPRYTTADWFTANYALQTNSERQRTASHTTRQEARYLRHETANRAKWDNLDTNMRFADRIDNIRSWKDILERTRDHLDYEITELSVSKDNLELSLEEKNLPNHINIENLVLREGRQDIDVVEDEVEDQMLKEREVIECIKRQLQHKIDESFEHLCLLQEARQQVLLDLQDKNIAHNIDVHQYNLNDDSASVTYKPDALRVPEGSLTSQQWEDFSRCNHERAETEMANSRRLRESILHTLQQTTNDLLSQHTATEYALRRRIHELEVALDELNWQKKQTEEEIAELEEDIRRLNASIYDKQQGLKLAQTRLENRTYRTNSDLCRDNVQYGLTDEAKQLEASLAALTDKLHQAQHALDCLEQNLHRLNQDIQYKTNSLHIDKQCLASREKIKPGRPLTVSERNMALTGISREKADILAF